jgi:glutamine amidotransferase-like uncharacterized protein
VRTIDVAGLEAHPWVRSTAAAVFDGGLALLYAPRFEFRLSRWLGPVVRRHGAAARIAVKARAHSLYLAPGTTAQ